MATTEGPTEADRRWAAIAHVASIPGMVLGLGFAGPLLVLRFRTREPGFARAHAVAAVNFNITVGLAGLAGLVTTASLSRQGDGPDWAAGAAAAIVVLLTVFWFLFTVRAAMHARYGEPARYPLALPLLNR